MSNKKTFNLEYQYQLYLKRVGLEESVMHPVQIKETRQVFFGACGQMLILLRDEVGALEEEEAFEVYTDLINQVGAFFLNETNRQN